MPARSADPGGRGEVVAGELDRPTFETALARFRKVADPMTAGDKRAMMDWSSELWLEGTRNCVSSMAERLAPGARVLDNGCGLGLIPAFLSSLGFSVKGIDIDVGGQPEVAEEAFAFEWASLGSERKNPHFMADMWAGLAAEFGIEFEAYDGRRVPAGDGSFDAVLEHGVFEHIRPEVLSDSLAEMHRVLSEGGLFFIFRTPRKKAYLEKLAALLGLGVHEATYDECEVVGIVERAGFKSVSIGYTDMLPSFLPVGMGLYNRLTPLTSWLDRRLLKTPLRRYAHHMALVFRRVDRIVGS
jgi:SAM-dependent methyltransferase